MGDVDAIMCDTFAPCGAPVDTLDDERVVALVFVYEDAVMDVDAVAPDLVNIAGVVLDHYALHRLRCATYREEAQKQKRHDGHDRAETAVDAHGHTFIVDAEVFGIFLHVIISLAGSR